MVDEGPFLHHIVPDQSLLDTTPYSSGKDNSVSDTGENAAHRQVGPGQIW
jgi:hypothetical protein